MLCYYDGLNRLKYVIDYTWDALANNGQGDWVGVKYARYVYDGGLVVQERAQDNSVTARYVWGAGLPGGIGALLARLVGNTVSQYHYDGRGNVVQITSAGGTGANAQSLRASYGYDAYGGQRYNLGTTGDGIYTQRDQPFRYSTKLFHERSRFTWFGARWYDAALGRFINRDPIGEAGGLNLYGFVENNPVNWVDPWGLSKWIGSMEVPDEANEDEQDDEFFDFVNATHGGPTNLPNFTNVPAGRPGGGQRFNAPKWLNPLNWRLRGWPWGKPSGCPTPDEPTILVYHKGELMNGKVSPNRSLSTGTNRASVEALNRKGTVHEFRIPVSKFHQWEQQQRVRRYHDLDKATGVRNEELRFSPSLSEEMNRYKVCP